MLLAQVMQHHDGCAKESGWVGNIFSGDVGSRAVDGLEHGEGFPDVGRAGNTDRSGELGRDIRYNIAVQVGHDYHVKAFRGIGNTGGANVDNPAVAFNIRVLGGDFLEDFQEEAVGQFHDVVFGKAAHFFFGRRPGRIRMHSAQFFSEPGRVMSLRHCTTSSVC